ncbi:MAG: nucleoside-diphosphate kinase [bacterium]|nr:nucleoside-diphosphate kinase [bacterium]
MNQRTFVMIKPDGVKRGLIGEIISTFERAGLQITRMEMRNAAEEIVNEHYPNSDEWLTTAGNKTIQGYKDAELDVVDALGTDNPLEIGKMIKKRLVEFICSGRVVTMIVEGNLAISNVRRFCGNTVPSTAEPSSIRGRYSIDSPDLSFMEKRPIVNLVHASGNQEEAEFEIHLWFGE